MTGQRPTLPGYTTSWDGDHREWVLRKPGFPALRGRTQHELELARNDVVMRIADDLTAILRAAPGRGYSPPPRT